jgi:spermidine synthase
VLSFPQPVYPTGWWSATLARSDDTPLAMPDAIGGLATEYYTADIHRAAFAQPAFLRRELAGKPG